MRVDKINLEVTNKQTNIGVHNLQNQNFVTSKIILNIKKILEQVNGVKRSKHCKIHIKEDIYAIN